MKLFFYCAAAVVSLNVFANAFGQGWDDITESAERFKLEQRARLNSQQPKISAAQIASDALAAEISQKCLLENESLRARGSEFCAESLCAVSWDSGEPPSTLKVSIEGKTNWGDWQVGIAFEWKPAQDSNPEKLRCQSASSLKIVQDAYTTVLAKLLEVPTF